MEKKSSLVYGLSKKQPSILKSPDASLVFLPCQSFCIWQNESNREHRAVDEYQNREDRQAEDMLNFWALWVLSRPRFCWSSSPICHFLPKCKSFAVSQYSTAAVSYPRCRANEYLHKRVSLKKMNQQFYLREKGSQNLYHSQYLDLFILKRAVADCHIVYPDRKYLTCFSCEPSVSYLLRLTALSLFSPHAAFAGGWDPFLIWHFHAELAVSYSRSSGFAAAPAGASTRCSTRRRQHRQTLLPHPPSSQSRGLLLQPDPYGTLTFSTAPQRRLLFFKALRGASIWMAPKTKSGYWIGGG